MPGCASGLTYGLHFGSFFGFTNPILRILTGNPQKGTTMETIGNAWDVRI